MTWASGILPHLWGWQLVTVFYGKELSHVRGWYFWLRRQLGVKKAIDIIKRITHHERTIANDIIHKTKTREIVNRAIETDR